ncbi:TRAP transporter fused permease subunit [Pusillimonas sp.]|uniref:TRAP transporter permease n=1 Tax=Pusillimonas sp. TaxID=3040095 RepID=UPI0029B0F644|nr:TRAP transporter fused permease subunit [Pusillimonas sp.]MDX3894212.1 TRAP transporter fused permease subunit [Pusillimonas sp.]
MSVPKINTSSKSETADAPGGLPAVPRNIARVMAALLTVAAIAWSADLFQSVGLVILPEQFIATMLGIGLALVYIQFPLVRHTAKTSIPWYDWAAVVIAVASGIYTSIVFPDLQDRLAMTPVDGVIISTVFLVLTLEGLRRVAGYALLVIVVFFLVYALVGHNVPGQLETLYMPLDYFVTYIGLDSAGLFGFPLIIATTIVITFIFFGELLLRSGGAEFFNELAAALMGRSRGGAAKIAVIASSLFGSISGSPIANIVATGTITIPMMKRSGFPPRLAAAVEATASTGGQLMPPVMGAVAFMMADFLERPYGDIVIAALVPAILYYLALFIQADLEAGKHKVVKLDKAQIPKIGGVLIKGGHFLLPFVVLIYALFALNWRAEKAAILAIVTVLILGLVVGYKGRKMSFADIWRSLESTGKSILDILVIVAGSSFIIGMLFVSGLGSALTQLIVEQANSSLFVLLLMAAGLSIILGMGMPTIGVYILLAVLLAPALETALIPLPDGAVAASPEDVSTARLSAHMFLLYFGMMSFITPPVAVAAFFAASIAKAPAMGTGWTCMRFGWTAYVVPFLFVFNPELLLQGDFSSPLAIAKLVMLLAASVMGVALLSAGMIGYFTREMSLTIRLAFLLAGAMLLTPAGLVPWGIWIDVLGFLLGAMAITSEVLVSRKLRSLQIPPRDKAEMLF